VNAVFNLSHLIRAGIAIAVISMLAACGQRGPLYLPKGQTSAMTPQPVAPVTDPAATPGSGDASTTTPSTQKKDADDNSTSNNQPNNQQK
jgi:predicted small lipoprotein YifL